MVLVVLGLILVDRFFQDNKIRALERMVNLLVASQASDYTYSISRTTTTEDR
jgi:hypothetical protein